LKQQGNNQVLVIYPARGRSPNREKPQGLVKGVIFDRSGEQDEGRSKEDRGRNRKREGRRRNEKEYANRSFLFYLKGLKSVNEHRKRSENLRIRSKKREGEAGDAKGLIPLAGNDSLIKGAW